MAVSVFTSYKTSAPGKGQKDQGHVRKLTTLVEYASVKQINVPMQLGGTSDLTWICSQWNEPAL